MNHFLIVGIVAFVSMLLTTFGGGGGSLIMLAFLLTFYDDSYLASLTLTKIATSVSVISAGLLHLFKSDLQFRFIFFSVLGAGVGTVLGTYLLLFEGADVVVKDLVPYLLFLVATYLIFASQDGLKETRKMKLSAKEGLELSVVFGGISILNSITGGLGTLFNAYSVKRFGASFMQAVAHGMVSGALIHMAQTLYLVRMVNLESGLVAAAIVGAMTGGYCGTHLQFLKGNVWIRKVSIALMYGVGIKLLFA